MRHAPCILAYCLVPLCDGKGIYASCTAPWSEEDLFADGVGLTAASGRRP